MPAAHRWPANLGWGTDWDGELAGLRRSALRQPSPEPCEVLPVPQSIKDYFQGGLAKTLEDLAVLPPNAAFREFKKRKPSCSFEPGRAWSGAGR